MNGPAIDRFEDLYEERYLQGEFDGSSSLNRDGDWNSQVGEVLSFGFESIRRLLLRSEFFDSEAYGLLFISACDGVASGRVPADQGFAFLRVLAGDMSPSNERFLRSVAAKDREEIGAALAL